MVRWSLLGLHDALWKSVKEWFQGFSPHSFRWLMLLLLRERLSHSLKDLLLCGKCLFLFSCFRFSINNFFFIPTCTPTQAVWTFLLCFYDLPVLVDIYYLLSSGQIMCIESFCINVPLQCPNFFSWDLLLLWILSHPSLHFTVPDLSLEIHFLQELWKPQAIRVVGRGKWVSL